MKKYFTSVLSILMLICLFTTVKAEGEGTKLLIDNVNIKSDAITVYFDVVDSNGKFNSSDINKDNVTAAIGENNLKIKSLGRFEAAKEGAAYVLMADISKSINEKARDNIKKLFSEIVNKAGTKDKIAVVTFGNSEKVIQDFTSDKTALLDKINSIQPEDDNTDLYRSITKALDMLSGNKSLPSKMNIVIMSDGEESNDKGITKDEVLLRIRQSHIPIFSVGLNFSGDKNTVENLKVLGSFARLSNGQDFVLGNGSDTTTDSITGTISERLNKSFVAQFGVGAVKLNGQTSNLNLSLKLDEKTTVSATENVVLKAAADNTTKNSTTPSASPGASPGASLDDFIDDEGDDSVPFYENYYYIGGAVLVLVIIIAATAMVITGRKKKNSTPKVIKNSILSENIGGTDFFIKSENNNENNHEMTVMPDMIPDEADSIIEAPKQSRKPVNKEIKIRLINIGKNNGDSPYELKLSDSIIIGRDSSQAKLVFKNDKLLSGRHCELLFKEDMVFITDLGSTNGTYVNGIPISGAYRLHNDDILLIGSMELRVVFDER